MSKYVFLVIALVFTLFSHLYTNIDDPFYWYNTMPFFRQELMQPLSFCIGHIWHCIVGDDIFRFRLLGWLMCLVSFCVPYIWLQDKDSQHKNFIYFAIGLFLFGPMTQGMYVPDSPTLLLLIVSACLVWKTENINNTTIVILALITALSTACRFPNILLSIVLVLYIGYVGVIKKDNFCVIIKQVTLYLTIFCISYFCILVLLWGRIDIFTVIKEHQAEKYGTVYSEWGEDTHSIWYLIKSQWWAFRDTFSVIISILGVCVLYKQFSRLKNFRMLSAIIALIVITLIVSRSRIVLQVYAISIVLLLLLCGYDINKKIKILVIVSFGFISAAGSDTGYLKIFPYFACLVPLVLIYYKNQIKKDCFTKGLICVFLFAIPFNQFAKIEQWNITPELFSVSILNYHNWSDIPHLTGLFADTKYCQIKSRLGDIEKFGKKDKMIFYGGSQSQELYIATNSKVPYKVACSMSPNDFSQIEKVVKIMEKDPRMILFDYTCNDIFRERLAGLKYKIIKESDDVIIYVYNEPIH